MNVSLNIAYFYGNYKFMFRRQVPFFSLPRIFVLFVLTQLVHEQIILKNVTMNNYRVNINDLFDQDEDFLFENDHFKALIRKVRVDFEYLVNPLFDLEEIVKSAKPEIDAKYQMDPNGKDTMMNQGDLISLYRQTFNSPSLRSRLLYDKMITRYDEFFAKEKVQAEKRMNALVSGRQIHDLIKQVIEFYDAKEKSKARGLTVQFDT